jgi:hypothetical protein
MNLIKTGISAVLLVCKIWYFSMIFLAIKIMFFDFGVFYTLVSVLLSAFLKTIQSGFILYDVNTSIGSLLFIAFRTGENLISF